ncbi:hypothetical protein, partial [uncultured Muribaculum sp.]
IVEYPDPKGEWWEEILMASGNVKESILNEELGEARQLYNAIKKATQLERIQCRMEPIVIE